MSEKSQVTSTSKNVFEKSNSKTQYFVREVKVRRMTKNGVEFQIGCRDFSLDKGDTWEPITNLPVSQSKRRQTHSFNFTTGAVKRMQSKEDTDPLM